jgi:simple sugar transport system permease protein
MKYYAVLISGGLAGLGGAFIVLVQQGLYREASTAGRGFIGLGALIFGNWMPAGVLNGALLFGFGDSLRFRGAATVRALLLTIGVGLVALAVWRWRRKRPRAAGVQGALALMVLLGYALLTEVPDQLITATPYLITLLVLAIATQSLRMPAADGARYRKGETG